MTRVTLISAYYILNSKYPASEYNAWIKKMLATITNCYLVIFTDENSIHVLKPYEHRSNIKIVLRPMETFYTYSFKDHWIRNHSANYLLNNRTEWKLHMLWSEKVHMVQHVADTRYFPSTPFYGWCDIGYFREAQCPPSFLNQAKIDKLNDTQIYYAMVTPQFRNIISLAQQRNQHGLPDPPIPAQQVSVAGGFFITHAQNIKWWTDTYTNKLALYFKHKHLVKDDQMIIVDCIASNPERFNLVLPTSSVRSPWFVFRYFLG